MEARRESELFATAVFFCREVARPYLHVGDDRSIRLLHFELLLQNALDDHVVQNTLDVLDGEIASCVARAREKVGEAPANI